MSSVDERDKMCVPTIEVLLTPRMIVDRFGIEGYIDLLINRGNKLLTKWAKEKIKKERKSKHDKRMKNKNILHKELKKKGRVMK